MKKNKINPRFVRGLGVVIALCGCIALFLGPREKTAVSIPDQTLAVGNHQLPLPDSSRTDSAASGAPDRQLNGLVEIARQVQQTRRPSSVPPEMVTLMADLENFITTGPSSKEWTWEKIAHLKEVFAEYLEIKTAYEKQWVRVVGAHANSIEFEVAPYPEGGAELKRMFQEAMVEGLADGVNLDPSVRSFIEHHFAYFGAATQRIRVTATTHPNRGRMYAITHSLYATDHLHRETGGAQGGFVSSTSSSTLALAQLFEGSYEHIAGAVAENFGDTRPRYDPGT